MRLGLVVAAVLDGSLHHHPNPIAEDSSSLYHRRLGCTMPPQFLWGRSGTEVLVQRLTMLVTPEGQWVFPNTAEFYTALGDPNPDYDATAFAVKNLGFIKFEVIEKSIIEIELHPRNVELPALLAVQQQLLSSDIKLFRIKYFNDTWQSEISSTAEHAVERLSQLAAPPFT